MAFEPGGFSTTTFVGTNATDLTWQVNHAAGTQLMLSMADGNGNAGGIPNYMFNVISGQDSSCLPSTPSTKLAITANVTRDLDTCEPWGLTVTGGTGPPYNITLAALGSPLVTNVTIPLGFDVLTYIDRAVPNGNILAAVSDSSGQFGNTTVLVNTIGSTNVSCVGLVSRAGNSTVISAANAKAKSEAKKSKRRTIIIAVCATIGSLIVISAALFALFLRRKKRIRGIQDGQDTLARVFKEDTIDAPESFTQPSPSKQQMAQMTISPDASPSTTASGSILPPPGIAVSNSQDSSSPQYAQTIPSDSTSQERGSPTAGSANTSNPNTPNTPLSPHSFDNNGRHVKTRTRSTRSTDDRRAGSSHPSSSNPSVPLPGRPFTAGSQPLDPDTEPDIIIQHRDGGTIQELPPPYLDHRDRDQPPLPLAPVPSGSDAERAGDAIGVGDVAGANDTPDAGNAEVPNHAKRS
jgi:hypothetical protein